MGRALWEEHQPWEEEMCFPGQQVIGFGPMYAWGVGRKGSHAGHKFGPGFCCSVCLASGTTTYIIRGIPYPFPSHHSSPTPAPVSRLYPNLHSPLLSQKPSGTEVAQVRISFRPEGWVSRSVVSILAAQLNYLGSFEKSPWTRLYPRPTESGSLGVGSSHQ